MKTLGCMCEVHVMCVCEFQSSTHTLANGVQMTTAICTYCALAGLGGGLPSQSGGLGGGIGGGGWWSFSW